MLFSIIIFVITLIILILIHEFGHFLAAKKFGIKVEEFGVGIPPRILGKRIGETLYSVNWIPYGGFVRLLGEDEPGSLTESEKSRDFRAKPVLQRILVVTSGVVMNLFLAWILFYVVLIFQNFKIIYPTLESAAFVGYVENNFPAKDAGIQAGDRILEVDNKKVTGFEDARKFIKAKNGAEVELKISDIDGNNQKVLKVKPKKSDSGEYLIGVAFTPLPFKEYKSGAEKLFSGVTYSYDLTRVTFLGLGRTLGSLFSGDFKSASQDVSGPVGIAKVTNNILSIGSDAILPYLWFVGVISLTLSIFNVLPIPALDGGRIFFLIIEAVIGKKVKMEIEKVIHQVGFAVLIFLAFLVTYSDIHKIVH